MNAIKRIITEELYRDLSTSCLRKIAHRFFSTFDNDALKILYLTRVYQKFDTSQLSMSPYKCAVLLVYSGTYEGGQ